MRSNRFPLQTAASRRNRSALVLLAVCALPAAGFASWAALGAIEATPVAPPAPLNRTMAAAPAYPVLMVPLHLFDPAPMGQGRAGSVFASQMAALPGFRVPHIDPQAVASLPSDLPSPDLPPAIAAVQEAAIPVPVPRPAELRTALLPDADRPDTGLSTRDRAGTPGQPRIVLRQSRQPARAALAPEPASQPGFFERLFGTADSPKTVLAYAAPDSGTRDLPMSRPLVPMPAPSAKAGVAVYDISAQTVTLPNGERLEAHSGLGDKLDNPRYVHLRMRGATPPGTYDLKEREALFHGVRAIRMNPVGGSAAIHGRAGILAHTYMLGPNGDSNGCISFKDYDKFLQAYLRGDVRRIVVVAGRYQDGPPGRAIAKIGMIDQRAGGV